MINADVFRTLALRFGVRVVANWMDCQGYGLPFTQELMRKAMVGHRVIFQPLGTDHEIDGPCDWRIAPL